MDISVILCTYNRCQELAKVLNSLASSNVPEALAWEVLIVDNNSRDRTPRVAEEFAHRFGGRFRYVFEGRQGKSYALNTGIQEARGEILAFVDDDVTVESNWLNNLVAPLLENNWVGTGGCVFPERDVVLPNWIERDSPFIVGPLVMFDLGPTAAPLKEAPFGTNMAFRKAVFQKHGGFRTDLGPRPGSELRGEDSELVHRLLNAGEPLYYVPSAVVYHSVSQHRLTKAYFLAWWFDKGRSDVRTLAASLQSRWSVAGVPLVMFRRLVVWLLKWMIATTTSKRFLAQLTAWYLSGEIVEFYRLGRNRRELRTVDQISREYGELATNAAVGSRDLTNSSR